MEGVELLRCMEEGQGCAHEVGKLEAALSLKLWHRQSWKLWHTARKGGSLRALYCHVRTWPARGGNGRQQQGGDGLEGGLAHLAMSTLLSAHSPPSIVVFAGNA